MRLFFLIFSLLLLNHSILSHFRGMRKGHREGENEKFIRNINSSFYILIINGYKWRHKVEHSVLVRFTSPHYSDLKGVYIFYTYSNKVGKVFLQNTRYTALALYTPQRKLACACLNFRNNLQFSCKVNPLCGTSVHILYTDTFYTCIYRVLLQ